MGLYARITATNGTKIQVHRFGAALRQWARGQLTRQNIIDTFALTAADITDLDALKASYDAITTATIANAFSKSQRLNEMEDVFLLCETGDYTEAKAKTALGF